MERKGGKEGRMEGKGGKEGRKDGGQGREEGIIQDKNFKSRITN